MSNEEDDRLRDLIAEALTGVYACGRVWEAWSYGTMTADDFSPASEDPDVIENVLSAVHAGLASVEATTTTKAEGKYFCTTCGERFESLGDARSPHSASVFTEHDLCVCGEVLWSPACSANAHIRGAQRALRSSVGEQQ